MNNQVVMDKFFILLKEELESMNILNKLEHISNADESGIDLNARQEKLLFLKVSNMPILNKRHQEIISPPWFVVLLLDKSCGR